MFGLFKKSFELVAPVSGPVIPLSEVPDEVFAQKLAGDGVAIDASSDIIVAPCDATLSLIFKTNHAFALTTDNGLELLVHIGIDTVGLNGEGFERLAEEGTKVTAGTPIIKIDREFIKSKGLSLVTPVLITNPDSCKEITGLTGKTVVAGQDTVVKYK